MKLFFTFTLLFVATFYVNAQYQYQANPHLLADINSEPLQVQA